MSSPELLIQVFINLIKNSYESIISKNLSERWINIESNINNNKLEISITDSGKGIDKEIIPRLMQPYYTTKYREKGIGLGLSISKRLVEFHNGSIRFDESSENTKFVISFNAE
jgi:signal transduction histidine kinase